MPHSLSVLLPALVLLVSLWPTAPLAAAEPAAESLPLTVEQTKFYMTEVKPILVANCFKCHGEEKEIKGGLQLTNRAAILTGGDAGPAVDLADPNESVLLSAINYDDYEMPPKGKLPPAAIGILTKWVAMGVPIPPVEEQALHEQEHEAPDFAALIRDYWAYQPLHRPASPTVQRADWPASPIDAFVLAKLEEKGLSPS